MRKILLGVERELVHPIIISGLHGLEAVSPEELARPGINYSVSNGSINYLGKQVDLPFGASAVIAVLPGGELEVRATRPGLSFDEALKRYGKKVLETIATKEVNDMNNYGEVISAWAFPSSAGTTTYETQLHVDGRLTCNCPGWILHNTRICKHTKLVAHTAQLIMQRKHERVFQKPNETVRVVEKVVEKIVERIVKEPTVEVRSSKRLLRAIPNEE